MVYTDVLIRIRGAVDATEGRFPVEAQIDGSGSWRGESVFQFATLDPGKQSAREYGVALGRQLLNPSVARALEQAGAGQGKPVRIRLLVDEEVSAPHWIRWERMYLRVGAAEWPVAISPEIPFSRYIPDERPDATPPGDTIFRLLLVVSNPDDLPPELRIDVNTEIESLVDEVTRVVPSGRFRVRVMPGRSGLSDALQQRLRDANWDIADGNATLDNISKWLHRDGGCHALHIIAHGNFKAGTAQGLLYLESAEGTTELAKDYELQSWIHPRLQLMVFQACRSAASAPEGEPPFVGIAPKMVRFGVPAVVAMQDFVLMTDARAFSAAFYRALMRDGLVDVAVNEGRRAIPNPAGRVESTIPALFMRLKGARLWRPDLVRSDVSDTRERLGRPPEPLPLKVIQHARGLSYDPAQGPDGPLFNITTRLNELVGSNWLTCLTGPPGFDKTAHLQLQFLNLARQYLDKGGDTAPFWVTLSELADWNRVRSTATPGDLRGHMQAIAARRVVPPELSGRQFIFLVEADQDLSGQAEKQAIDTLLLLLKAFPDSRALIIYDETSLSNLAEQLAAQSAEPGSPVGSVAVLVVRPMEWTETKRYLIKEGESRLADVLETRQVTDIAGAPWILEELRSLAGRGRFPLNRADALGLIAASYLVNFDTQRAPRSCAELALERIAWRLQMDRVRALDSDALLTILAEVRDRRDFRYVDLSGELIRCGTLARSGEDAVRFTYHAVQAYFAARYLQKSPRKLHYLEDVTASLGRYSRVRHWEAVLIALAGLQRTVPDQVTLLQAIVSGSSLSEGEQVFLAVLMYMEMSTREGTAAATGPAGSALKDTPVVRQIVDTLIWRLRADTTRPYADRRQAVERLAEMRHPDGIAHLIALAVDPLPTSTPERHKTPPRFDNAGMRMVAVNGLLLEYNATLDYVDQHRPELKPLVEAWLAMVNGDLGPVVEILKANDPSKSAVAAFALGQAGMDIGGPPLLDAFFRCTADSGEHDACGELLWAIAEVFGRQESGWLYERVIKRWLDTGPPPDRRLCYLIQKYGQAPQGSGVREYLDACLKQPEPTAQDRALRALSKVNDPETNRWLLAVCHDIVRGDWDAVLASGRLGLRQRPTGADEWRLKQASLEIFRDIGGEETIEVIRNSRVQFDPALFQLSFQVAEQLYWRITGGLAKEDFTAIADQRS